MSELTLHKAQPTGPQKIEPVTVVIAETIPEFKTLNDISLFASTEANRLEQALYNSLPGATYDRLLGIMLERKATHFRVAHGG
jgi:hypothetical protein